MKSISLVNEAEHGPFPFHDCLEAGCAAAGSPTDRTCDQLALVETLDIGCRAVMKATVDVARGGALHTYPQNHSSRWNGPGEPFQSRPRVFAFH